MSDYDDGYDDQYVADLVADMEAKCAVEVAAAQRRGYEAAVREVVAWIRDRVGPMEDNRISWPVGDSYRTIANNVEARFLSAPAEPPDPRMAAIAHGQSDEYRERFLREKQPPSPATPPAAEPPGDTSRGFTPEEAKAHREFIDEFFPATPCEHGNPNAYCTECEGEKQVTPLDAVRRARGSSRPPTQPITFSAPAEPPADDWCKCPIKTKGKITLTYHPIGGHAAPLLDGFRCQHCNRRVEAFRKAAPSTRPRLPPRCASGSCGDSPMAERSTERRADTPPSLAEAQTKRRIPVGCASCPSASSP